MQKLEWLGCLFGLAGSALLAAHGSDLSKWGFVAFLASNIIWISFGLSRKIYPLVVMQLGFLITSVFGITQWFSFGAIWYLLAPA